MSSKVTEHVTEHVTENVIEISGLTKKYGKFTAVDNLSLNIGKGEVFGLLGPNGAGKSTTILMLTGLTEPASGTIRVCGLDPVKNPIEVKKKVGYLPEDVGFYDDMSGLENLKYTARLNGINGKTAEEKAMRLLDRVGLSEQIHKKAGKYSRGMRQRLGLADALIKDPEVIILDEPTLGIDPAGIRDFLKLIAGLSREEGITVLFSSHHLHQVQQVCDRVGIFVDGKLLAEGKIDDLAGQLFSTGAFTVTAEINLSEKNETILSHLQQTLGQTEGVDKINFNGTEIVIECNKDITTSIARIIVNSGAGLTSLNKKKYGLDDIYQRYFEGGTTK